MTPSRPVPAVSSAGPARRAVLAFMLPTMLLFTGAPATAQSDYPSKPVRFIVPSAAGGSSDIIARVVAQKLSELWGQPVVIDNRGAVSGIVGAELGQKAAPDGYTLTVGNSGTHVMNYGLYKTLPYDPINGFAPIAKMGVSPTVLIGNSSLPFTNARELVAYSKANSINMASPGATALFASRMFNSMAGTDITIIPYKGSAPADLSVIQNETQVAFTSLASARSHVQGGRVRIIATTSLAREPAIANVPTLNESGVKGYELEFWVGLFAPAGTPARIVEKVNADLARVLKSPDVQKRLDEVGFSAAYMPTAAFADYVRKSAEKNAKLMRELGIQPE